MDHLVQFTISIDDAHIARIIEERAAKTAEETVLKACKTYICPDSYWGGNEAGPALKKELEKFMKEHKDEIIDRAADKLADKMIRTKMIKQMVGEMALEKAKEED